MKIAICVYDLYNGGAERVASLWANGFAERNEDVLLVTCAKSPRMSYSLHPSVRIENIWGDGAVGLRYIRKLMNLRKVLRNNAPDVILAVLNPFDLMLPVATLGLGIPCINTEHNTFERPQNAPMSMWTRIRKLYVNRLFKAVTVLTQSDKRVIGNRLKRVFVMPNPVTFEISNELPIKNKVVLAAGRLDNWYVKGFDVLIDAWAIIHNRYPEWELAVAGRGGKDDEDFLLRRAESQGITSGFKLLGYCDNIQELYKKTAVFAFPSRCDGFGMVLTEAMSQGCACVSCDYLGRQAEIITSSEEGVLIPTDDKEALSSALELLMSNEELRQKIQIKSMARARDFNIERILDKWYSIFERLEIKEN